MDPFVFETSPNIICAPGALREVPDGVSDLLGPRILLITDRGVRAAGLTDSLERQLSAAGTLTVFDEVEADPSRATVEAALRQAQDSDATGVLGVGGGSPIDVAKVVALLKGSDQPMDGMWGVRQAIGPRLPLVLAPTTAGTGSEVTPVAIITVGEDEKKGIVSPHCLPDMAVLDPESTLGLPPATTAATGIDAMVHAIEAYTSRSPNANPVSRGLACQALQLLGAHIHLAVNSPENLEARAGMLLGSMLAGQAFANAPVAAVHALAYPIGGRFHVPHGLSNALVLAEVMRFNLAEAKDEYAALAPLAFADLAQARDPALAFIDRLETLSPAFGLPSKLRDLSIPHGACAEMAQAAMAQTRLLVNNPRPVREEDAKAIYEAVW
ncbi:MAG: iron-containing alcohol dehydrogenase [Pseudomonadota bacterium]